MARLDAQQRPRNRYVQGAPPVGNEMGRGGRHEEHAVGTGLEKGLDNSGLRAAQGYPGRVRQQEADGNGLWMPNQIEAKIKIGRAEAEVELLPDAIALKHGGLLLRQVELACAEPVEESLCLIGDVGREQAQRLGVTKIGAGQADGNVQVRGRLD